MAAQLKASISRVQSKAKTHDNVLVKVRITNTGKEDVSILTWNTPLDRLITDCLDVSVNGKNVEYDGPMVKRAAPKESDYLVIKAGQTVEAEYPVSDAYDTSRPGSYEVKLKTPIPDVAPKEKGVAAALASGRRTPVRQPLSARTAFKIEKGQGNHLTLGAAARHDEKQSKTAMRSVAALKAAAAPKKAGSKKNAAKNKKAKLMAALTSGGTAAQKAAALKAHAAGYALCKAALAGLVNGPPYVEWFGAHTAARFGRVKKNYAAVKKRMETVQFTYNLTGSGCTAGVYAYTYKGTSTIWFCDAFWDASATGTDSKAGTVLHEHTHSDASTDDITYGQASCRTLAISHPGQAIQNADTHEYYAGG
jgi:peptidyl-Lys metalloendopeptidase